MQWNNATHSWLKSRRWSSSLVIETSTTFHFFRQDPALLIIQLTVSHIAGTQSSLFQKGNKESLKKEEIINTDSSSFYLPSTTTPWEEVAEEVFVGRQIYAFSTFSAHTQLRELTGCISPHQILTSLSSLSSSSIIYARNTVLK